MKNNFSWELLLEELVSLERLIVNLIQIKWLNIV